MKIWIIKRKGGVIQWYSFPLNFTLTVGDKKFYTDYVFYRKKDAKAYLKTFGYPDLFEVVGISLTP